MNTITAVIAIFILLVCDSRVNGDGTKQSWVDVLKTDVNGNVVAGSKTELLEAITNGLRTKIRTDTYSAEMQNCQIINNELCCQGLLHISYDTWEKFQSKAYWWMVNVCTTGHWHMVRCYVGGGYLSETRTTGAFSWYVLRNIDNSYNEPALSKNSAGFVVSGCKHELLQAIKDGKSFTVYQSNSSLTPIQNVQLLNGQISAQHVWSVSQKLVNNHIEFQGNAYWWFLVLTPAGSRDMSRWNLGAHVSRGHTQDTTSMSWFVDNCWAKIYPSDCSMLQTHGYGYLKYMVESGHRIKVAYNNTFMEADSVRVSDEGLSVQLISQLARKDASTFKEVLNWEFRTVATSGTIRTYRPLVGSASGLISANTKSNMSVTWFVDCSDWKKLFHMSMTGDVLMGSALAVREAVKKGADIRVGYKLPGDSGFRYSTADNVNFGPSPDLSVQLIRLLRDHAVEKEEFELDVNPAWSFKIVTTKGYVRSSEWVVGEHTKVGEATARAEIVWFAGY